MSCLSREHTPLFSRFNQLIADRFQPVERQARWATHSGLLSGDNPGVGFPNMSGPRPAPSRPAAWAGRPTSRQRPA